MAVADSSAVDAGTVVVLRRRLANPHRAWTAEAVVAEATWVAAAVEAVAVIPAVVAEAAVAVAKAGAAVAADVAATNVF